MSIPSSCDQHAANLAELALGILTGRERAATLAHVDACPRCAEELEQLAHAADAVVRVAPEFEPTMGFEVRLFSRMGLAETPPAAESAPDTESAPEPAARGRRVTPLRWVSSRPRWVMAAAAAVIALAIGLGIGWNTGSGRGGSGQAEGPVGTEVATAALIANGTGRAVGNVQMYGGSKPWMLVTLADSRSDGNVTCEVVTTNGVTHNVGSFTATYGFGAWGAPLRVAPQDIKKAEVVSSNGTVIATASLS